MKANWQSKPIGDVFKVVNGGTPKTGVVSNWDGPHAWITPAEMGNLETPFISESRRTLTDEGLRTGAELVPAGSIILSSRAPIGHLVINQIPMAFNQGCKGLIPSPVIDTKFAYYFLLTNVPLLESLGTGATFKELSGGKLKEVLFQFPDLGEQRRIVTLLDEAFDGITIAKAHAERNLQNARAIFESHLQSVFIQRGPGWIDKPLGDLCDFLNGFAFKSGDAVAKSQTQLVRIGNLFGSQLDLNRKPVFYPDRFATDYSRYVLVKGDIIMSLTGTTDKEDYGFAVRVSDSGHNLLMNQRLMKFEAIRCNIIDDGFLLYYLRSRCFLDILYPTANGTRQANLSSATMKLLPVPLPSLKEQKEISNKLDSLTGETQRLTRLYEKKLTAREALKKSILHQAFNGQI